MANIKPLQGPMTLREMYPVVNDNLTSINADGQANKADITQHKTSKQAHGADAITYAGEVPGATVKEAIEGTNRRISEIVAQAGDSNTEIVDARGGAPVLGDRLNSLDAQLADIVDGMPTNAAQQIKLMNPYNNYQNIHPKVLHFPDGLWGYKFWMGYTPYPGGNTTRENPCIAVSQNGIDDWGLPDGLSSGLMEDWDGITGNYNNDTHLVYRADIATMELWWRHVNSTSGVITLKRRTTTDGVTWTSTETMVTGHRTGNDHICPTLWFEDSKYKMLSVNTVGSTRVLYYQESTDGGYAWSTRIPIVANWGTLTPWHMDVIKVDGRYEMVMQAWDDAKGETNNTSSLYYMQSIDCINWTKPIRIISPSFKPSAFDNAGIYRSSVVKVAGFYYVYYSALNKTNQRAMGLSIGRTPLSLIGYDGNSDLENLGPIMFANGSRKAGLRANADINHVLEVVNSNDNNLIGGIKVGGIVFANGLTDGVVAQDGNIRYNGTTKRHQVYRDGAWTSLASESYALKKLFAVKTAAQTLTSGVATNITFGDTINLDEFTFDGTTLNVSRSGQYRISIALMLQNALETDDIELYVQRNGTNLRPLCRERVKPDVGGMYLVDASTVVNLTSGANEITFSIKYTTTATNVAITASSGQNYVFVERV